MLKTFIKTVIGDVVAHLKTTQIHRFVRFVMYCFIIVVIIIIINEFHCDASLAKLQGRGIITTCSVECYWHCSDETATARLPGLVPPGPEARKQLRVPRTTTYIYLQY